MILRRCYREMTTSNLRALHRVLSRGNRRWLFGGQLAAIELELQERDLPGIAEECGGHLVPWILGDQ